MKIIEESYRFAGAVLRDRQFKKAADEVRGVLSALQPVLDSVKDTKIRHRKSGPAQAFPVNQKKINKAIEKAMPAGWDVYPLVVPREMGAHGPATNIKADFKKSRIQLEVQFGNMARWYTDVFKFQLAYSLDTIDVGILVVPTQRFANLIDENVASYERVLRELPWAKMSLTLPILVIGIEPDDYSAIKKRYQEAGARYLNLTDRNAEKYKGFTWKFRPFSEALSVVSEEPDQ